MAEYILFVFEGEKTEQSIVNSFTPYFISDDKRVIIYSAYKTDIYKLYMEVFDDEFLDVFEILKEKNENLKELDRQNFSQIYLFFDYDGHAHHASDDKINNLLSFFDEETDHGKLFISYPMVESIKNISDRNDFINTTFKIDKFTNYKQHVAEVSDKKLIHFNLYSKETWCDLIRIHCEKANFIVSDELEFPSKRIEQSDVFLKQKEKHIDTNNEVSIVSAFPLMILDYYGSGALLDIMSS